MRALVYGSFIGDAQSFQVSTSLGFDEACHRLEAAIAEAGFWILHRIETPAILAKAEMKIPSLRQYLFFHPDLMRALLESDPGGILGAPLKVAVLEMPDGTVKVLAPKAELLFSGHPALAGLAKELAARVEKVLQSVTV